jgi:hypothetical protein
MWPFSIRRVDALIRGISSTLDVQASSVVSATLFCFPWTHTEKWIINAWMNFYLAKKNSVIVFTLHCSMRACSSCFNLAVSGSSLGGMAVDGCYTWWFGWWGKTTQRSTAAADHRVTNISNQMEAGKSPARAQGRNTTAWSTMSSPPRAPNQISNSGGHKLCVLCV